MIERQFKYQFFVSYTNHENEVRAIKPFVDEVGRALNTRLGYYPIFIDSWVLKDKYRNQTTVLTSKLKSAIEGSPFSVCFLSYKYALSEWCKMEYLYTETVGITRFAPAPEYSLLPIIWKDREAVRMGMKFFELNGLPRRTGLDIEDEINNRERDVHVRAISKTADAIFHYMRAWHVLEKDSIRGNLA